MYRLSPVESLLKPSVCYLNVDWGSLAARARAKAEVVAGLADEAAAELAAEVCGDTE